MTTIQRITRKEKSENPPPLYDLTTLQRDANRLLGYSAQQTLDYVQSLYEKKLTTYPRTDSCYITDDDEEMLEELTEALERFFDITPEDVDDAVPRTRRTVNRENVNKKTLEQMAEHLGRSALAVQLYMHRKHIVVGDRKSVV